MLSVKIEPDNEIKRIDGKDGKHDFRLSRFALYIIAMNANNKLPNVAKAQTYFANQAELMRLQIQNSNDIERLEIRDDITNQNKLLLSSAKNSGVVNFAFFLDAGYRGMYNKSVSDIKSYIGFKQKDNVFDFMNKRELAANLFRITQTEASLEKQNINSERSANLLHKEIGSQVRQMYLQNTGYYPEDTPIEKPIKELKKGIKETNKTLTNLDKPKKLKK